MTNSDIEHMAQGYPPSHIGRDHEEVVIELATSVIELQQKLDEIAAENAAIKSVIEAVRGVADNSKGIAGWHLNGEIASWDEILPEIDDIQTPATDAYMNSLRAEGLKMAIDHMNNQTSDDCADVTVLPVMEMYKKLVTSTHDTADKAG